MTTSSEPMYRSATLANGLRVLTVPIPHVRSVTVAFFLGAGSRYETEEEAGLSHFVEHMVFKGTKKRPLPQQIAETVEGVGGYMNASTDREATVYWVKVAKSHFPIALDLLSDMLLNSLYDPTEMERERKVILEEISSIKDSPPQLVDLLIDETLWPDQPLGRDVGGTKESVNGITKPQMLDYIKDQYASNNTVLAVAGDLQHEEVVKAAERQLGQWAAQTPRKWFPAKNGENQTRVNLKSQKTEQAHLCIAFPGLSSTHPDRYALDMLNVVLGEGMSSRLFLEIRERRGLAYDVHSYVTHLLDDGCLTIYAGVDTKNIDSTIHAILQEIERLKDRIPDAEFRKAREMTKGRMLLRTEDTRSMASWVGAQELLLGEVKSIDDVVDIVEGLTLDDLQRVARDLLTPDKVNLAVVGPYRSQARFERLIS